MEPLLNSLINIFFLAFLLSLFAMGYYLYEAKVYTYMQLRFTFMWPRLIFEYRDHTRKFLGKTGKWYPVCKISFSVLSVSLLILSSKYLLSIPLPISIVIFIAAIIIFPSIGFVIYNLSKDKYF